MSVAVRGVSAQGDPARPRADRDPHHERLVIVTTVLATLVAVAGPLLIGGLGRLASVDDEALSPPAQRVLAEVPGAFETEGLVVVPANTDAALAWVEEMPYERIDGAVVDLGTHGLADYGYLPLRDSAPGWLMSITPGDSVFSDAGPLAFACTRFPSAEDCTGTLLMEHEGELYIFRAGLALADLTEQPRGFRALDLSGPAQLVLGTTPPETAWVELRLAGDAGQRVTASLSDPGVVDGATLWWATVSSPIEEVTFLDAGGRAIGTAGAPY